MPLDGVYTEPVDVLGVRMNFYSLLEVTPLDGVYTEPDEVLGINYNEG